LGNSYTIELMNLHTDIDSNSNTTSLNENEKAELNDNKLLFSLKDLEKYQDTNDVSIKNKIKELYEIWLYEQAKILFKEKINKFSKMIESQP